MEGVIELIMEYIKEQAMILVPVLWIIGMIIKKIEQIKNKYIPVVLFILGVVLANLYLEFSVEASLQGVLAVGLAVFIHQLKKQGKKAD